MTEDMNTDLISVQIQSLLNIPPIRHCEAKTEEIVKREPNTAFGAVGELKLNGEDSTIGQVKPVKQRHRFRSYSNVESQHQPNPNSLLGGPPHVLMPMQSAPRVIPHLQQNWNNGRQLFQRNANDIARPVPDQSSPSSNGYIPQQGQRSLSFDFNTGNMQQRARSKIISHMNDLLRNEHCPKNMIDTKDKLITAALEEHKPMYHLHLDPDVLRLLAVHCIEPLTTKSVKYVRAKYFCFICNYHMDNITNVLSHASNPRHEANAKVQDMEMDIKSIPFPSQCHVANLGFFLETVMQHKGIHEFERALRISIWAKLNAWLGRDGYLIELFGSTVSGFGFTTSDINFNLDLTSKTQKTGEPLTSKDHMAKISYVAQIVKEHPAVTDLVEGHHGLEIKFKFEESKVCRNCSIQVNNVAGVLLSQLFEQYNKLDERVRYIVVAFRYWARQTGIDDQELGYFPGYAFSVMALKYLTDVGVIPHIIIPETTQNFRTFFARESSQFAQWKSENREPLGSLWLGLLRRYSVDFPFKEMVVSLVQKTVLKSEDKVWNRKIAIEDPIIIRSNLCRSASTTKVFDYILHVLKLAFKYFGLPQVKAGTALFQKVVPLALVRDPSQIYFHNEDAPQKMDSAREQLVMRETPQTVPEIWLYDVTVMPTIRYVRLPDYTGSRTKLHIIAEDLRLIDKVYTSGDFYYEFTQSICQGGQEPPKHCKACGKDDHCRVNCPEEAFPPSVELPYPEQLTGTVQVLDRVLESVHDMFALTGLGSESDERNILVQDIYSCLIKKFPDVELRLFGSTANGFCLRGSDVDVSVRFTENPIEKSNFHTTETSILLQTMVQTLKATGCMQEVIAIPTAKVPIIKFKHKGTRLEGDISLYNALPLRNTKLLRCYSKIDRRVQILVCMVKQLTKICDIGDASKGSLSSYAYVIMVIHFLQHLPVPVLPVLQQILVPATEEELDPYVYEGLNTYFFSDVDCLPHQWERFGGNTHSVGHLLLSFFIYYTEVFNYERHVITINQFEYVGKKLADFPATGLICIEDPFEVSHNLAAGLTRRMSVFIIKTFQRLRAIFSRNVELGAGTTKCFVQYYLDPAIIRGENHPPVDRQCRICNKIGHYANSCNFRGANGDDGDGDADVLEQDSLSPAASPRSSGGSHVIDDVDEEGCHSQAANLSRSMPSTPIVTENILDRKFGNLKVENQRDNNSGQRLYGW